MNCSAIPRPHATPAATEAERPFQSKKYSMADDSSPSASGWYSSARLDPHAMKKKVAAMKKKAL